MTRGRPELGVLCIAGILLVILVAQSTSAWNRTLGFQRAYRTYFPHDLAWVDHHSDQPVATLAPTLNQLGYEQTEFFNDRVIRYYGAQLGTPGGRPLLGLACNWAIGKRGFVNFGGSCGKTPSRFLVNDPTAFVRFHDESQVATDPKGGRLVTLKGRPRVKSVVFMPCEPRRVAFTRPWGDQLPADRPVACAQGMRAYVWVDQPATLLVTIRGGTTQHVAQLGEQKRYPVPAGQTTTLKVPVSPGGALEQVFFDWASRGQGEPEVVGVSLAETGQTTSLIQ